ncbi:hypothetical protein AVEN_58391-1 [Araneus ventricosus]|uniref:Uncharacterized protein n=1 Tax=Araneus ventricosus TaxID=182803 RepID=A0A4Y2IBT8_ARAVE|nr:hypothetical protein AVEN_58391-1 [Araneus ventricosus]
MLEELASPGNLFGIYRNAKSTADLRHGPQTGVKSKTLAFFQFEMDLNITRCYIDCRQRDNLAEFSWWAVEWAETDSHFDNWERSRSSNPKDWSARWRWVCQCQPVNDLAKWMATTLFSWCGAIVNV